MMTLYSGITCPFSQRCRIVLYEKGMDFEIIDVDIHNKPEDLAVMNPYNEVPVLVERDLILHESNIINEYIDERFPHPQLMPADPVMRARAESSSTPPAPPPWQPLPCHRAWALQLRSSFCARRRPIRPSGCWRAPSLSAA